jgi:acyl dehydratase
MEMRPLNSRPGWGLMTSINTGTNQRGERVLSFVSMAFIERRPGAAA